MSAWAKIGQCVVVQSIGALVGFAFYQFTKSIPATLASCDCATSIAAMIARDIAETTREERP